MDPMLPFVFVCTLGGGGIGSSSSKLDMGCPRADALLGAMLGFLSKRGGLFGSPAVPRTLDVNLGTVGLP